MGASGTVNLIICGVGGQGVILISEILGSAAVKDGIPVAGSEIHGMAARGGSVSSHIRIGKGALAPTVPIGKCDILLSMEPAEALRNVSYLSEHPLVLLNTQIIFPYTVSLGRSCYPPLDKITNELAALSAQVVAIDAFRIAEQAGNAQTVNTAMIGCLLGSGKLPISTETVKKEIETRFGPRAPANLKAFDLGYRTCERSITPETKEGKDSKEGI
jgi:indolepyruvate ferredoxin oxidoreductase beta subunit